MAEVKWIKLATDIFDNRKIRLIEKMPDGDTIIVIWIKLLCLAGTVNDNGLIYLTRDLPYTDEMLSTQFDRPLTTIRLALTTFEKFGMIEVIDDFLALPSWERYQNVEGLERVREQNRVRKQKQRESQRLLQGHVTVTGQVTQCHATDIDKEEDIDKENIGGKPKRFMPPTIQEVTDYCNERKNGVDPARFVDFYEAKGWMVGKNKMKDWKAAVRTWERSNPKPAEPEPPKPKKQVRYREVERDGEIVLEAIADE